MKMYNIKCWWEGGSGQRGIKGGKWDNCNSKINKIYFKKKKKKMYTI